jgi:two-component system OmpR family response regulator
VRILVAEDDRELAEKVARALERAGFAVDQVHDGHQADFQGRSESYDAAVLDLGLPQLDGLSVLRGWREAGVALPVLILTARSRWSEKQAGFHAGADDYLTKPFEMGEVVLRVQALIRRSKGIASPDLVCGSLRLDTRTGDLSLGGEPLELTGQEHRVLAYLLHHAGRVVSRTELLEHVYARDRDPDSNVLDVLIGRVRRKLGRPLIETVRGRGYRLVNARE